MAEVEAMTAVELNEWTAYERVYGSLIVGERIDAGFALIAAILYEAFKGKGARSRKPRDFMPEWFRELTASDELERGWEMFRGLAAMNGGGE